MHDNDYVDNAPAGGWGAAGGRSLAQRDSIVARNRAAFRRAEARDLARHPLAGHPKLSMFAPVVPVEHRHLLPALWPKQSCS